MLHIQICHSGVGGDSCPGLSADAGGCPFEWPPPAAKNPRLRASCAVVAKKVQSATAPALAGRQREWKPQAAEQENSEDG